MILNCPSCSTQYFADDASIGEAGRTVRCAACNTSWFAKPELSLEDQLKASDLSRERVERERQAFDISPHLALREKERSRRRGSSRLAASIAWGVSSVMFFALGVGAVQYREDVVKIWPQASSAYAFVGLDINTYGLEFVTVDADRSFDGTIPILKVSGDVLNITQEYQITPVVRVDLRDENGQDLEALYVKMDTPTLEPGGIAKFSARLDSPPVAAFDLEVSFVDPDAVINTSPQDTLTQMSDDVTTALADSTLNVPSETHEKVEEH